MPDLPIGPVRAALPAVAAAGALLGVAICGLLAGRAGPEGSAWAAALSLGAACLLVGLGGLEYVEARPSRALIAAVAGFWGATSLVAAWLELAGRAGVGPWRLGLGDLMLGLESGLAPLICVGGAVLVLIWCARPFAAQVLVAVIAAAGVLALSISGHAATGAWTPLLVGAHALAAAWWTGTLAALAVSVRGRRGWSVSLPLFSGYALYAAAVLVATGVLAALVELGVSARWWDTGYGRVVLAKAAILVVVLAFAATHRRRWVPAAARHAAPEAVSLRRAAVETILLSVVLGLAAGLATTAPGVS
ncbi:MULTISPECIES: copper resistance D family protein [unclassified Gordonia (in: high G+C Gram-positive bacteria)]|uniref:copper resistance D family protein n=1 Tax=unclassified Gordonia (in: high G+C Gram-positive bacteria) TaxID=2657482 RepID=UPI001FFEAFD6|nr:MULTISPECIES: CopD family protein [unclassified Gordonia (in: high G+C Gram-positive bacteria)]UQE75745.1 CopD family protein [Gordonia sp. PP30]